MKITLPIILTILFFSTNNILFAQSINIETAKEIAKNHLLTVSNKKNLKSASLKKINSKFSSVLATVENNDTLFFILNDTINNNFVIVASDKRERPILGYSTKGNFDGKNMPLAFIDWIESMKKEIASLKTNNIQADSEISQQWDKLSSTESSSNEETTSVGPLLFTTWNQGCYYNTLCPTDGEGQCGHVYTGCTATSMAQIMKYWSYPTSGTGSYSDTVSTYGDLLADFSSTTYQWSQMPDNVISENNAVATLMYHCGVSVDMDYSPSGSSACLSSDALSDYFNYSSQAQYVYKSHYSTDDWVDLLKSELDLKRPIWYTGQDTTSGHAFVCDGYQNTDYFHFNWGWGGRYDGYFYLGDLTPGLHDYSSSQGAVIGIFPTSLPDSYDGFFLSDNSVELRTNGGSDSLTIISSTNWTVTSDQTWLALNTYNGVSGTSTLIMTATENSTESTRSATVTVSANGFDDQFIVIDQAKRIEVTAGGLNTVLAGLLSSTINLKLSGTIDARDFTTMRDSMPVLANVDLSLVTIVAYSGTLGTANTDITDYYENTIPENAFSSKSSLNSVILPSTVLSIESSAFVYCRSLTSITLPTSLTTIGSYAFRSCNNLTSITFPTSLTTINYYAFIYCNSLDSVTIPSSVTTFSYGIFYSCSNLATVVISEGVNTIGQMMFKKCSSLTSITIPSTTTSIKTDAFNGCSSLTSITIPQTVSSIGSRVFSGCTGLTSIVSQKTTPVNLSSSTDVFLDVDKNTCKLYVPFESATLYAEANQWMNFTYIIELTFSLSTNVTTIEADAGSRDSIIISSNIIWTTSSDQSWLVVDPESGSGNDTLIFIAEENLLTTTRIANVTVSAIGATAQIITITQETRSTIADNLKINNTTILYNKSTCFNAYNTITVAGDSTVIFADSSFVDLIAGQSISFLPGFHAESGSYMNASITSDGIFCDGEAVTSLMAILDEEESIENEIILEEKVAFSSPKSIKIYPNPNSGNFTIELTNFDSKTEVNIYNMLGETVYNSSVNNQKNCKVNLPKENRGLYFVKVCNGKDQFTKKLIIK